MKAAITVELNGSTFALDEGAFVALRSYLERAAARLKGHPDQAEVLAGLERSIAAKLARGPGAHGALLDATTMSAALKEVGRVEGPELGVPDPGPSASGYGRRPRRLYRLRDGQQIAGVCTGLSAFSEVDVGMIRFIFILATLFSGGLLLVGYVILMFVMPLARTDAEITEARGGLPAS